MPYITPNSQDEIDAGRPPENVGELTYALQQVLKDYLQAKAESNDGDVRYAHLAELLGALEGAKLDLINRVISPYEFAKCRENGDVWPDELTMPRQVVEGRIWE